MSSEPRESFPFKSSWWPAPVTLISCGTNEGGKKANIWAVGVLGAPCGDPPILTVSPRVGMYSYRLMKELGEFVVNIPSADMIREMEYCGTNSGVEVDKWKACGFTPIPGEVVKVPLIAECPVNYECTIVDEVQFERDNGEPGEQVCVFGRVVAVHAHSKYLVDGVLQWDLVDTIYRARPRTWRTMGPVLGYDCRQTPLAKPEEASELVAARVATLEGLADAIRQTPYPTQTTTA
jgi:flavin reductase (DIM6/NTAB) family NADH-FMN oxidoreductase RutF